MRLEPARAGLRRVQCWVQRGLLALLLGLSLLPTAQAHLMVAQRGTLNLVGDGAFLVLSLPVSTCTGVDDDQDGRWPPAGLRTHAVSMEAQVQHRVQLRHSSLPLQALMLRQSPGDHSALGASGQAVVLGRFARRGQRSGAAPAAHALALSRRVAAQRLGHVRRPRGTGHGPCDGRPGLPAVPAVPAGGAGLGLAHAPCARGAGGGGFQGEPAPHPGRGGMACSAR